MPRPFTKDQILQESKKEHENLEKLLAGLTEEQMTQPGVVGEWAVKDVLAHLYEWEQMVMGWLGASQRGETPAVPGQGFKWSQLPALNQRIYETYRALPLTEVLEMYRASHQKVTETIQSLPEEMLFKPGLYPWMNKNTLAAYFVSCTSSHYRWAAKEIRSGLKQR